MRKSVLKWKVCRIFWNLQTSMAGEFNPHTCSLRLEPIFDKFRCLTKTVVSSEWRAIKPETRTRVLRFRINLKNTRKTPSGKNIANSGTVSSKNLKNSEFAVGCKNPTSLYHPLWSSDEGPKYFRTLIITKRKDSSPKQVSDDRSGSDASDVFGHFLRALFPSACFPRHSPFPDVVSDIHSPFPDLISVKIQPLTRFLVICVDNRHSSQCFPVYPCHGQEAKALWRLRQRLTRFRWDCQKWLHFLHVLLRAN